MMKKNSFGFAAVAVAVAMVLVTTFALVSPISHADAEAVTISQASTVVASPFTEAVQKVHGVTVIL